MRFGHSVFNDVREKLFQGELSTKLSDFSGVQAGSGRGDEEITIAATGDSSITFVQKGGGSKQKASRYGSTVQQIFRFLIKLAAAGFEPVKTEPGGEAGPCSQGHHGFLQAPGMAAPALFYVTWAECMSFFGVMLDAKERK